VTVRRGSGEKAKEIETELTLAAELPPYLHPFLGVLPKRSPNKEEVAENSDEEEKTEIDPAEGEEADSDQTARVAGLPVRAIWPESPADKAGLHSEDLITHLDEKEVPSLDAAYAALNAKSPGDELQIAVRRGNEELKFEVELAELPDEILASVDLAAGGDESVDRADLGAPKLQTLKLPEMSHSARYLQPPADGVLPGLVLWLGDGKSETVEAMAADWHRTCVRDRLILLMPEPADPGGWSNDDLEYLARLLQTAGSRWRIDPRRIIVAGEGKGGQLAYALALRGRQLIRGVAVVDSPLPRTLEVPENNPNERLAILSVETQNSPLSLLIRKDLEKLEAAGYPVTQIVRRGEESRSATLDGSTRGKIARWIDGLDRL
jgi:poly(3-hydroxybutyrate) depolymerase